MFETLEMDVGIGATRGTTSGATLAGLVVGAAGDADVAIGCGVAANAAGGWSSRQVTTSVHVSNLI
jgi:hypothetical protein